MGTSTLARIVEAAELVLDEVENQLEQNEDLTERIEEIEAADTQLVGQLKQRFSRSVIPIRQTFCGKTNIPYPN